MMKKLNNWLCNHCFIWNWEGKEGVAHLWAILISFVALALTGIFGWNVTFVCALLYLVPIIGLPVLAGVIALIKKQPWNPWYWFPIVIGTVIGGILAIAFCLCIGVIMITVTFVLKQLVLFIPTLTAISTFLTGVVNGAFNVENGKTKHIISWIVPVVCGVLTVLTGGLVFDLGVYDYLLGAFFGLVAGGASNGVYEWEKIETFIDNIYFWFGHGDTIRMKRARRLK